MSPAIRVRGLLYKELLRFAPVVTALLCLLISSHVLAEHVQVYPGVPCVVFLVPGLVMMSALQNAFANSSSSLIQSKVTGNIVFVLLPPLSCSRFLGAYVAAAVVRGMVVGEGVLAVTAGFADLSGVFYSIHFLASFWHTVSQGNPVFYVVDGFRFGFLGVSDVPPMHSFAVVLAGLAALSWAALALLKSGYKLRH